MSDLLRQIKIDEMKMNIFFLLGEKSFKLTDVKTKKI